MHATDFIIRNAYILNNNNNNNNNNNWLDSPVWILAFLFIFLDANPAILED
jgi:hypothetical protein